MNLEIEIAEKISQGEFSLIETILPWFFFCRMYGHPYWPAKVIGLVDTGNIKIDVRFFGTPPHERQNILVSDTLLFSDNPNKKVDGSVEKDFRAAVKVSCSSQLSVFIVSCAQNRLSLMMHNIQEVKPLKALTPRRTILPWKKRPKEAIE